MTTVEQVRATMRSAGSQVRIAGVPWPVYKLVALATGLLALVIVGALTTAAGPAVLSATAAATLVWIALGRVRPRLR